MNFIIIIFTNSHHQSFYFSNNSNPTFENEIKRITFDKKILGLTIEKQCENMIALAPVP
jgi:hypothetical protein